MNYLKIENEGLIDINAISLLGASTKRDDSSKIGQFGSGNKFAIAYLLRNNYELRIFRGLEEIKISLEEVVLRDKVFNVICFNGEKTSITTEFGKDWELWQSIREIYCNAIDEGNHSIEFVKEVVPVENKTIFFIKRNEEINNFISNFDDYFSENKKVLFECKDGKILEKGVSKKLNLYRKGIKCIESEENSIFDYDLPNISIDENRLVKYSWQVPSLIWNIIYQCDNEELIKKVLLDCSESKNIENISSTFSSLNSSLMSETYKKVAKEMYFAPSSLSGLISQEEIGRTTIVPLPVFNDLKSFLTNDNLPTKFSFVGNSLYQELEWDAISKVTLDKAIDFFEECNFKNPLEFDIVLVRFEDKKVLGMADLENNKILISEKTIAKGVQSLIETIIEEYIHLKYKVFDETRGFQDAIITEFVSMLKVKNAYLV